MLEYMELDTDEDFIFLAKVQQGKKCKCCGVQNSQNYCKSCKEKIRAAYEMNF